MAKPKEEEAQYAPPASQVDLEERRANDNKSDRMLLTAPGYEQDAPQDGRDYRVEGNDLENYISTSPEYMTYANETEAPLRADDSVEEEVADEFRDHLDSLNLGGREDADSESDTAGVAAPPPAAKGSSTSSSSGSTPVFGG
jgi:hypothetical protein